MKNVTIHTAGEFTSLVETTIDTSGKTLRELVKDTPYHHTLLHQAASKHITPRVDTALRVLDVLGMEMVIRKRRKARDK